MSFADLMTEAHEAAYGKLTDYFPAQPGKVTAEKATATGGQNSPEPPTVKLPEPA